MSKRVYFAVEGRVQVLKVEGEAQASEEVLSKFFKDVDDGPRSARVTKVSQEDRQTIDGESDFSVTR
ncbi:hypothetical protein NW766_004982 [Fusarium irregulare]|uniref:Acylphosphatase-like domain-containing protein n=1 Tax=Fusarium irregulare TaxID=2494466 RepID=A0A9W8PUH4_9HYPO|nr:hypothetical protein NW766_004982 [Fusarium irregulare]